MEFETTGQSGAPLCETGPNGGKKPRQKNIYALFFFFFFYSIYTPAFFLRCRPAGETTKNDIGNQRTGEKVIFRGCLENITRPGPRGESQRENGRDDTFKTRQQRTKSLVENSLWISYAIYRIQLF